MILDKLPNGHWSVKEIIKALKKHTAENPVVDLQDLMDNLKYMDTAHNYTIGLMREKDGKFERFGHVVAVVETNLDLEILKDEIKKAYKRVNGRFVEPEKKVVAKTTTVDDLEGSSESIRINKKSDVSYGKKVKTDSVVIGGAGVAE